ncbi:MAG: hypothetical protein ACE5LX_05460 [Nitrospinota bacterium]
MPVFARDKVPGRRQILYRPDGTPTAPLPREQLARYLRKGLREAPELGRSSRAKSRR